MIVRFIDALVWEEEENRAISAVVHLARRGPAVLSVEDHARSIERLWFGASAGGRRRVAGSVRGVVQAARVSGRQRVRGEEGLLPILQPGAIPWLLCLSVPTRGCWYSLSTHEPPGLKPLGRLVHHCGPVRARRGDWGPRAWDRLRASSRRRSYLYPTCCMRRASSKLNIKADETVTTHATDNSPEGGYAPNRTGAGERASQHKKYPWWYLLWLNTKHRSPGRACCRIFRKNIPRARALLFSSRFSEQKRFA
jgi:hypothetical protein